METPLKRFLGMLGGSVVAAAVITVTLAPPSAIVGALTFALVLFAGALLSYVIGYLGAPWESTAYPPSEPRRPTDAARVDATEFRWSIREGIGVAIASMFGLLLLILFLQETALVQSRGFTGRIGDLALLAALAVIVLVLATWSWRGRNPGVQYRRS